MHPVMLPVCMSCLSWCWGMHAVVMPPFSKTAAGTPPEVRSACPRAGATGLVGSRLVSKLSSQGHVVRVLTRNVGTARAKLPYGRLQFFAPADWASAFDGATGVVNLAGGRACFGAHRRPQFCVCLPNSAWLRSMNTLQKNVSNFWVRHGCDTSISSMLLPPLSWQRKWHGSMLRAHATMHAHLGSLGVLGVDPGCCKG